MIKQISMNLERVFIPEFEDNKKQDANDQIKVHYKAITSTLKEDLIRPSVEYRKNEKTNEVDPIYFVQVDMKRTLEKLVTSIENLGYATNGGDTKKITGVQALFDAPIEAGFYPLIQETFAYFQELLVEGAHTKN